MTPDIDHAPSIPELLECPSCDGIGTSYGLAPHRHSTSGSIVGSSRTEPRENWPPNFHEDPEVPGLGVWVCATCDGAGQVENPIAMVDHDDDDDPDPWPFGDVIELVGHTDSAPWCSAKTTTLFL